MKPSQRPVVSLGLLVGAFDGEEVAAAGSYLRILERVYSSTTLVKLSYSNKYFQNFRVQKIVRLHRPMYFL